MSDEPEQDEQDFEQLLDDFIGGKHFEGESGVGNFEKVCEAIGYKETGFRYGSPIESFLCDNSGCIEAMLGWIADWGDKSPEWRSALEAKLKEKNEDAEDEDAEDDDLCSNGETEPCNCPMH